MNNDFLFDPLGGWIFYTLHSMQREGDNKMAKVYQFLDEAGIQVLTRELLDRLNEKLNVKLNNKINEIVVTELNENSDDQHSLSARALFNIINTLKEELLQLDTEDKADMNDKLSKKANITDLTEIRAYIAAELLLKANLDDMIEKLNLKADKTQLTELDALLKEDYNRKLEGKADKSKLNELRESIQNIIQQLNLKANITDLNQLSQDIQLKLNEKADTSYVDDQLRLKVDQLSLNEALELKASKQEVDERIQAIINSAPESLDTLKELSDALGNDANFAATVTNKLSEKANTTDLENINTSLQNKANTSDIERLDNELSNKANTSEIERINSELALKATKDELNRLKGSLGDNTDISSKLEEQKSELLLKISEKANSSVMQEQLELKADKTQIQNLINEENLNTRLRLKADKEYVDRKLSEINVTPPSGDGSPTPPPANLNALLNKKLDRKFVQFEDAGAIYAGKIIYENNKAYLLMEEVQE